MMENDTSRETKNGPTVLAIFLQVAYPTSTNFKECAPIRQDVFKNELNTASKWLSPIFEDVIQNTACIQNAG